MRERGLALAREGSREGACNVDAVWMPDVDRGVLGARVHTDTHTEHRHPLEMYTYRGAYKCV